MNSKPCRKPFGLLLIAVVLLLTVSTPLQGIIMFPDHIRLSQGQLQEIKPALPFTTYVKSAQEGILEVQGRDLSNGWKIVPGAPLTVTPHQVGSTVLEMRLFGFIPWRRVVVDVVPRINVVPGGHSIGVLVRSSGLLVVGYADLATESGTVASPSRQAGIKQGDLILRANGQILITIEQLTSIVQHSGHKQNPVRLTIQRAGRQLHLQVKPVQGQDDIFRLGLYVKDGSAGVGTLTFYDPETKTYAALGHPIVGEQSEEPLPVRSGRIVKASISGIQEGVAGVPGEKIGVFKAQTEFSGTIEQNTIFGISGHLQERPREHCIAHPVPIALATEVHTGPAEIITVLQGDRPERYAVEISRVYQQQQPAGKGLIIKVTDERLLQKAGGIVQGMSGSPIIQDGRLVGAVTHVMVNDPTRGYGVFIEWMVRECGLWQDNIFGEGAAAS